MMYFKILVHKSALRWRISQLYDGLFTPTDVNEVIYTLHLEIALQEMQFSQKLWLLQVIMKDLPQQEDSTI